MGGLTEQDRILMFCMKLIGTAETYLNAHPELQEDIPFDRLKALLIERF